VLLYIHNPCTQNRSQQPRRYRNPIKKRFESFKVTTASFTYWWERFIGQLLARNFSRVAGVSYSCGQLTVDPRRAVLWRREAPKDFTLFRKDVSWFSKRGFECVGLVSQLGFQIFDKYWKAYLRDGTREYLHVTKKVCLDFWYSTVVQNGVHLSQKWMASPRCSPLVRERVEHSNAVPLSLKAASRSMTENTLD